jgi:hypothetical protein
MSIRQNFPTTQPSLVLDFANSKTLDPRITFSRTTTATRMNELGLIEVVDADEARFDHRYESGYVKSLGLLVEESRTNLIRYSIISNVVGWSISGSTVTNNAITAPDGTNTAARIQVDPGGYVADLSISVTAGQTYTFSFWVKSVSGSGTWGINIYDHGGANIGHHRTTVNITEEWQRVSYTYTPTGTLVNVYVSDNREGLATISDAYVWGAQLEQGSFKTSLIPTEGSTVTRTPDNVSMVGENFSSWYNQDEGTVYTQFRCDNWNVSNNFGKVFTINEGISGVENNGFWIGNDANTSNSVRYRVRASGINQFGPANLIRTSNIVKSALSVKTSDFAVTIDGNTPTASTSGTLSTSMTNMTIGRDIVGIDNAFLNGTISKLTYYPVRLTNSQLQNLTK